MGQNDRVEVEIIFKGAKAAKDVKAFVRDAEGGFKRIKAGAAVADKGLGAMDKSVAGLRMGFASLKTVALGAIAAIGTGAYVAQRVVSDSIKAASNLQEVQNKFNVVFNDQIKKAGEWADILREKYIMSRREAREYLSSMQDLLVPMGMASKEAGNLSFEIVKLAADLGSFNNMPTAQVMGDIQSALVGNYETMKKYGVVLNATVVQQRALELGLAKTKDALTAADKAQAAYNLIVQSSSAAIGDVGRSYDSYENQHKKFKANLEDLQSVLGTALLPTATGIVASINDWVKANEALIQQKVPEYVDAIGRAAKIAGESLDWWLSPSKRTEGKLVRQITDLEEELKRLESWEPNFINKFFGQEKDYARIEEVKGRIATLKKELEDLWVAQGQIVRAGPNIADIIKQGAEEQQKQAEAAKKTAEQLPYIFDGQKRVLGETENAKGNYSKIKTAAEEMPEILNKGAEKLQEENELLKTQIELLKQAAREASLSEGGIKSFTPGMKYGGPVLPMGIKGAQLGETIPGFGGGDKHLRLLEGGEEVIDKATARYARQRGIFDALREAAHGGMGQQKGYHIIDFRFGAESHQLKVIEDEEIVEAFIRGLRHHKMTRGDF